MSTCSHGGCYVYVAVAEDIGDGDLVRVEGPLQDFLYEVDVHL